MKKLIISTLVASVFASSAAMADSYDDSNFVNVGVNGQYTMFSKAKTEFSKTHIKYKSLGYGASIGYAYALDPSFRVGTELGYSDLGRYKVQEYADHILTKQHMLKALITADYFITPSWSITGKAGPALVYQSKLESITGTSGEVYYGKTHKSHRLSPYVSLGTAYTLDNGLSVGVSYGHLFGSKFHSYSDLLNSKKVLSSNSVLLTVGYTFSF